MCYYSYLHEFLSLFSAQKTRIVASWSPAREWTQSAVVPLSLSRTNTHARVHKHSHSLCLSLTHTFVPSHSHTLSLSLSLSPSLSLPLSLLHSLSRTHTRSLRFWCWNCSSSPCAVSWLQKAVSSKCVWFYDVSRTSERWTNQILLWLCLFVLCHKIGMTLS